MGKTSIKNVLHLIVDSSMSIKSYRLEDKLREVGNKIIYKAAVENSDLEVTLFDRRDNIRTIYRGHAKDFSFDVSNYKANGGYTAIKDALVKTLEAINLKDSKTVHLVMLLTDGDENHSLSLSYYVKSLVEKVVDKTNTTVIVQGPKGSARKLVELGLDRDNILEWEQTEEGLQEVERYTSGGLSAFYDGVSRGITKSKSFYVQPDLRKLSEKTLERKLDDLSNSYGIFTSREECQIRDFVERTLKRPYVKGESFYRLVKTETVQPSKEVIIFNKNNTELYGGEQARSLIGLPKSGTAKVVPGEHANYEIFIQSSSVNRKVLPGDKLVIKIK